MIYKGYLPLCLQIGIPYETAMNLNMAKIEPFIEAFKQKRKILDEEMWMMGIYIQDAVMVAVEKNLAGKKAKSKYFEKPLLEQQKEQSGSSLTEEQKHAQVENLFLALELRKRNWEMEKADGK